MARGRAVAGVVSTLAAAALLAGCSGASTEPQPSSPTATSSASEPAATSTEADESSTTAQENAGSPSGVTIVDATELPVTDEVRAPLTVTLDELDIEVPVDPVGVAPDGQMEIPEDALRAGWYRFGPGPGQPGVTVVAAHAGSYVTPRGPFYSLTRAEPGMRIEVMLDSEVVLYEVVGVEILTKEGLDLRPYFEREGESRLVLITCGGVWDDTADSYLSNVIVTARIIDG